jgi:hypothetical protein
MTLSTESVPLFWAGLLCSIQLSPSAPRVAGDIVHGGGSSTVQLCVVTSPSATWPATTARTRKLWLPTARPAYACGEVHAANAALSSEHSYVTPASPASNSNAASLRNVVAGGAASIVTSGGMSPISQVYDAGDVSVLPKSSLARTRSSCSPFARPV